MATQDLAAVPTEPISIEEIKSLFPDEWVLIGNPVMDEKNLNVVAGTPLFHSRDRRELAYLGRDKAVGFKIYTVVYTGTFKSLRRIASFYTPRNK